MTTTTPLNDTDRDRLNTYIAGVLGALEGGEFDREQAEEIIKDVLHAAIRRDDSYIRSRLDELDRHAEATGDLGEIDHSAFMPEATPAELDSAEAAYAELLVESGRLGSDRDAA